ncbi:MAG TPA: PIN domain-containing protein [Candidatus Bathyarchaeia archaeon]|nr:PIN domain-containing protein [Candidatus Bathyarchaeia archaeon]
MSKPLAADIRQRNIKACCSELAIAEMMYVTCREKNWAQALQNRDNLLNSNLVIVQPTSGLVSMAAQIKCDRALALSDCFTLALARMHHCEAIFAKPESELSREQKKKPFDVPISYLVS